MRIDREEMTWRGYIVGCGMRLRHPLASIAREMEPEVCTVF